MKDAVPAAVPLYGFTPPRLFHDRHSLYLDIDILCRLNFSSIALLQSTNTSFYTNRADKKILFSNSIFKSQPTFGLGDLSRLHYLQIDHVHLVIEAAAASEFAALASLHDIRAS